MLMSLLHSSALRRWRGQFDPSRFQGWGRRAPYFEGWYCKIADPAANELLAFIPGIIYPSTGEAHAFIQVLDGRRCQAHYYTFPLAEFSASATEFAIQIGSNAFSARGMTLDLPGIQGVLEWENPELWPWKWFSPGIMGWFSFVPGMQCYHGVVSFHHRLKGTLELGGVAHHFSGGIGYLEKDWGSSFPRAWIWLQGNHFADSSAQSLLVSIAHIPWMGHYFIGFLVALRWQGRLYRFATYTGAQMLAQLQANQLVVRFRNRQWQLEVLATPGPGAPLRSPSGGAMVGKVNESMQAQLVVRLYQRQKLVLETTGQHAGMEIAGPVEDLLSATWRR